MEVFKTIFFSLVRNSLWETQVDVPCDFKEWNLVMRLAKVQAMQGCIAKGLLDSQSVIANMKPGVQARMSDVLMTNVGMHSKLNCSLQVLVLALRDAGIECVLLKGQGLASYYTYPDIRQCGDIDLYVGVENYYKSYEVLKAVVNEIDDSSVIEGDGKHYHAKFAGTMIEVHKYSEVFSSSTVDRIYQRYASEGLSHNLVELEFGEIKVNTPADNFNAFYIFSHFWNHFLSGGIGLRQICDWAVFLHARGDKIDKEYLRRILTELKLMVPWKTFGCIAVDVLGLPEVEFPFYESKYRKNALKVLDRILIEGNFGQETEFVRRPTRGYLREKLFSFKCYVKRFSGLVTVFPYHAFQLIFYSITGGIVRLFKDIKK